MSHLITPFLANVNIAKFTEGLSTVREVLGTQYEKLNEKQEIKDEEYREFYKSFSNGTLSTLANCETVTSAIY